MKDFFIRDAAKHENAVVTSYFLLSNLAARERKGGGQYLALTLADRTGSFDGRMWENFADVLDGCSSGCYVKAQGRIERYNGRFQLTLQKLRNAAESEVEAADFMPVSQADGEQVWQELLAYVDAFQNKHLQALVLSFLHDPELGPLFRKAPAAKVLHHAWLGGLLDHVVSLVRLCLRVAPQYADEVDADLLVTAAILHDFGKVRELSWKRSFAYTTPGQLLGHITIGIGMVRDRIAHIDGFPEPLAVLVEHMMLSHHGKFEFGSPKLPMTPEAVVFSALDDLEAKIENMRAEFAKALESGRKPEEVTDFSRSLERPLLNSKAYLATAPTGSTESDEPESSIAAPIDTAHSAAKEDTPQGAEEASPEGEPQLIFASIVEL